MTETAARATARLDRGRAVAVRALDAVLRRPPQQLEAALEEAAARHRPSPRDRALARRLVSTVLRRRGQLDQLLRKRVRFWPDSLTAQNLLRIGAAQLVFLETPPHAAVGATVSLARALRRPEVGMVNAVLRRLATEQPDLPSVERNVPAWLLASWTRAYGEAAAQAIMTAHLEEPPLDLSVPGDRETWAKELGGELVGPLSVRLKRAGVVTELPGFAEGHWWVQDVAATLPVWSLGDVRGLSVLDVGAAPGGKTAQLAAAGAVVTAVEPDARRRERLNANLERLGHRDQVNIIGTELAAVDRERRFDVVLVDAPCSATGTIRRHPDIPWHRAAEDVAALAQRQQDLLDSAALLVGAGGRLLFATCSLQQEEGEMLIGRWLADNPVFDRTAAVRPPSNELGLISTEAGQWRSLPSAIPGGMDGFFFCHLRAKGADHG
ncbi:MAG: transcription antitermination factor NusB [Pseudomonadota bacterium]